MAAERELLSTANSENAQVVILNGSLADSELHRLLLMQHTRIKGACLDKQLS